MPGILSKKYAKVSGGKHMKETKNSKFHSNNFLRSFPSIDEAMG